MAGFGLCADGRVFAENDSPAPLKEFGYGDVELAPGLAQTQFEHTQSVLLSLNEDSLLKPWRLRAGLPAPGPDLGGWYDQVTPLDKTPSGGHGFAPAHSFGQWISALSRGYAVNRDPRTRAKIERLLDLYGAAISGRFYSNFRFPAYNYDKMVIGLVDAHRYAGHAGAFSLLERTTDAAEPHLPPRALDRGEPQRQWRLATHEDSSDTCTFDEPYTLSENLYIAAQAGAGERYRKLAPRFLLDETFFDPLSQGRNVLDDHHAYSYCNAVSSAMQAYLAAGSQKHLRAATNFFKMLTETQSFATGGWGPNESFSAPGSDALFASLNETHRGFETPCGSYAHFKLTRYLLRVTGDGRYGDSMERVLYNTVLGAKPLEPDGRAFYYSDYNTHGSRSYFPDAWPCCSGTLPQVAADYRVLGYFQDDDGLYVNLYLPSTVSWITPDGAQASLSQEGDYPIGGKIQLRIKLSRPSAFAVRLRIPAWSASAREPVVHLNGSRVSASVRSGFSSFHRTWKDGDRIELDLAMPVHFDAIDSRHSNCVAVVRGPLVLFALTEDAPSITRNQLMGLERISNQAAWRVNTSSGSLRLVPFTEIGDSPYRTYLSLS